MTLIYDTITAPNVAGYWNARQQNVDKTVGEKVFPPKKQLGLKLAYVKGSAGVPVVLRPSAFDTKATLRERMHVELTEEEMPYFKEGLLVKEHDRQQLNLVGQTGNRAMIDTITKGIFDDTTNLVAGAHARLEAMRMQVLATGKIGVISNGVAHDFDYGVKAERKGEVKTAWSDADTATPIADINAAIQKHEANGGKAEVMYLNSVTFAEIQNAKSTLKVLKPLAPDGSMVTKNELKNYLESELGLTVVVKKETYRDDDGVIKKYFPDGHVSFAPNSALGNTVFGTTPAESDLLGGNTKVAKVQIVDTGIAITTTTHVDPVNVETIVSMIALPSFEQLDDVYMLSTVPSV